MRTMIHRLLFVLFCTPSAMSAMDTGSGKSEQEEYTIGGTKITHFPAIVARDSECTIFDDGENFSWGKLSEPEKSKNFEHTVHYSGQLPWYHMAELSPQGTWFLGLEKKFFRPGLCIVHRDDFSSSQSAKTCGSWDYENDDNTSPSLRGIFMSEDTLMFVRGRNKLFSISIQEMREKGTAAPSFFSPIYTGDPEDSSRGSYFRPIWKVDENNIVLVSHNHIEHVQKNDTAWKCVKRIDARGMIQCVISPAAMLAAAYRLGKEIDIFDLKSGKKMSLNLGDYLQPEIAFSPDGRFVACVKNNGTLAVVDSQKLTLCCETPTFFEEATGLTWCAAGLFVRTKDRVDIIRFAPIDKQVSNNNNA